MRPLAEHELAAAERRLREAATERVARHLAWVLHLPRPVPPQARGAKTRGQGGGGSDD